MQKKKLDSGHIKFSVITVVYNGAEHLEQTIKSVLSQDNVEIQYIIIDGGSTDGTLDIIKKYSDKISYWVSETDKGIYDAMNKGLNVVSGDIVSFINSDDWYESGALECISKYFTPDVDIVCGRVNNIRNDKVEYISGEFPIKDIEQLHLANIFCHQGMFIRKNVFDKIGKFNLEFAIAADYEWSLRAHNAGCDFMTVSDIVANYRLGGMSDKYAFECSKELYRIRLKEQFNHFELNAQIKGRYIDACKNEAIRRVMLDENESVSTILNKEMLFFIWGAGLYGRECVRLLENKKMNIHKIIDSNNNISHMGELSVYSSEIFFDEFNGSMYSDINYRIIVTPAKYENEIIDCILSHTNIELDRIIKYSEIRDWCFNKYINQKERYYCEDNEL